MPRPQAGLAAGDRQARGRRRAASTDPLSQLRKGPKVSTSATQAITRPLQELFGRHSGYGFAGVGVNTAIGNYVNVAVDLPFPAGLYGLLNWTRTYNSRNTESGALGVGWTTSYSAHLSVSQQGVLHHTLTVEFHDDDGRVLTFSANPGGGFNQPQDLDAELAQNADGSFTLSYGTGEVWSFTSSGQLSGRSREGQSVAMTYDSAGLLQQVTHSSGRSLALSYDSSGRLAGVEASDGRVVSYAHDPAGTLASATLPGGAVTQYASTGSGQISQITDADGNVALTNTYSAQGMVATQGFAPGGGASFGYDEATASTSVTDNVTKAQAVFEADSSGRLTELTGPLGGVSAFAYDGDGHLISATTPGGTELSLTYDTSGNVLSASYGGATTTWTYDTADRVISTTDPTGATTEYAYAGSSHVPVQVTAPGGGTSSYAVTDGLITQWTDADGNTATYGYDDFNNLISATNPLGAITQYGYDSAGNQIELIAPSGASTQYAYDAAGRVTTVTRPDGAVLSYQYSAGGLLLAQTDPTGATTSYGYDAAGNQTSLTDPLGRTTTFTYDGDGRLTTVTDPAGAATQRAYDAAGNLVSVTDAAGAVTSFTYDADGRQTGMQTPAGTTATAYDARGNVASVTDAVGGVILFGHDADGRVTSVTDPAGGTWLTTYDAVGNIIASADPNGGIRRQSWTPGGNLAAVADPLGRTTTCAYDKAGHPTAVTSPEGGATEYAYDADGRLTSVTTPAGLVTSHAYDSAGRLIAVTDPRGWITRYVLDQRGDRTAVISPSGAVSLYRYDAAGQLTESTDPNGSVTEYVYDSAGSLISVTDAKGATTRYGYDADKRLTPSTDPLGRTTLRAYDESGNLVTVTDPSGQAQHMAYDPDGRLTTWTGTDGTVVTFTYDAIGRRTSMTDATGTTRYSYDGAGNLVTVTEPDGATTNLGYDAAGQRTSLTYPDGLEVTYGFDGNGRLTSLRDSRAGQAAYALDPDGRLLTEQLPGRLARRYEYEHGLLRRFLAISDGRPVARTTFDHDPDGRILAEHDDDRVREYRYDRAGQLVYTGSRPVAQRAGRNQAEAETHLTYDAVGNRASIRRGGAETHYRYDAADQLVAAATGARHTEFRYDSSGRLTEETDGAARRVIEYGGFGRPSVVTRTGQGRSEQTHAIFNGDGLVTSLVITAVGERSEEEQSASVHYRWSAGDQVPQILSQRSDRALDDTLNDRNEPLSADFSYGYGRVFASTERGGATFHQDAFGSAIRTDETRDWAQAHAYDVFGEPDGATGGEPRHAGVRPPELPRFGYRGELALERMLYLRSRAYDTSLGRFTTHDAVSVPTPQQPLANPYAYADNDPLDLTDPLGRQATGIAALVARSIAIADAAMEANRSAQQKTSPPPEQRATTIPVPEQRTSTGRSGLVIDFNRPITMTPKIPILETIVPPVLQPFLNLGLVRGEYQAAHCDLYLNNAQTGTLIQYLGGAGLVSTALSFPSALIAFTSAKAAQAGAEASAAELAGAVLAAEAGLIFFVLALKAGEDALLLYRLNEEGGSQGIYFDFYLFRLAAEVPTGFSWPWGTVRYTTFWTAWQYLPLSAYVWYQGSVPASPFIERVFSPELT
jgi:RHS repeat-associated protein